LHRWQGGCPGRAQQPAAHRSHNTTHTPGQPSCLNKSYPSHLPGNEVSKTTWAQPGPSVRVVKGYGNSQGMGQGTTNICQPPPVRGGEQAGGGLSIPGSICTSLQSRLSQSCKRSCFFLAEGKVLPCIHLSLSACQLLS